MSDKNTAGSSTAKTQNSTTTNSTNNGENKMSYFDELSKHLSKSVITKLNKLGQDITEELVTEIVAAQGQGFTGIGSKTCETIKEAMDLIVVEEKVETPKIKPISRKVKSVINNQFTFGMRTPSGTTGNQARTVMDLMGSVVPALVMSKDFEPQNAEIFADFGMVAQSKTGQPAEATITKGRTLSDFVKESMGDAYEDETKRRAFVRELMRLNKGLQTGVQKNDKTVKMPGYGANSWKVNNFGMMEWLGSFLPSSTRQREYARFVQTTHSLNVVEADEYLVCPVMIFSSVEKMEEFNKELILKDGTVLQRMEQIETLSNGHIVATRWNDGMHWISKEAAKAAGAGTLCMGRTINPDGMQKLAELQTEVNEKGSVFFQALKEFKSMLNAELRQEAYELKFLPKLPKALQELASKLKKQVTKDNRNKMGIQFELALGSVFSKYTQKMLEKVPKTPDTTFSKGTYLIPQKNEFSLPGSSVGVYYKDIKSKNKKKMVAKMMAHIKSLDWTGKCNQKVEHVILLPTGKKTIFSLLERTKLGKTSWGHQLTMWYKNWNGSLSLDAKKRLAEIGITDAKSYAEYIKSMMLKCLELKFGTTDIQKIVAKKTKGSLANEASQYVFKEMGADWIQSPEGKETFEQTFESIFQDLFKGRYFQPGLATFITPNIHWALKMVKDEIAVVVPVPEHLRKVYKKGTRLEMRAARYPSNTSDNPVHCWGKCKESTFARVALDVVFRLVADCDGDTLTFVVKVGDLTELEGKDLLTQELWNAIVDISIEKKQIVKSMIEDIKPINVTKTITAFSRRLPPKIRKIVTDALIYPNQAPVGPVANHIQTISILDMMTERLMVILGALLQNVIDTQKSLNDFYWLVKHDEITENVDRFLTFPSPDKWKRLTVPELKKVLLKNPYAWLGRKCTSYMGFSPEVLLPVCMKEALMSITIPEQGTLGKFAKVMLPFEAEDENGNHIGDDGVEQEFCIHYGYFQFFKNHSPYMPSIPAITHWIKYQIGFPEGYSQSATPWHSDSQGKYTHFWRAPYCKEPSMVSKYATAGSTSIVSTWYDTVKAYAEESWEEIKGESNFWSLKGTALTKEQKVYLSKFPVGGLNAYSSSNVSKDICQVVVENFVDAAKNFVVLDQRTNKVKNLFSELFKVEIDNTNRAEVISVFRKIDAAFFEQSVLPFGIDWHQDKNAELRNKYGSLKNSILTSLIRRGAEQSDIDEAVLREAAQWSAIKRRLQSTFEFFAAQLLPSACSVWTNTCKELEGAKREEWENVYNYLSIAHGGQALSKCPSCFREFLKWKGGKSVAITTARFSDTTKFLLQLSSLPGRVLYYGIPTEKLPEWLKKHIEVPTASYEEVEIDMMSEDDYLMAPLGESWNPEESEESFDFGFDFDFEL